MKPKCYSLSKRFTPMAIILVVVATTVFGFSSCQNSERNYAGTPESVTIGMESTAVNSLIYIAENQNYFAANGLNVTIKDYASGLAAVNGMLNNEVDMATASEFVIVGKALANESIRTAGSIDKFRHNYLIGRKDRGIENITDLEGKRVGLPLKTAAEAYFIRHPAEARAIVQKRLKYEDAYMATIWPEHQFSLSLDQSLILAAVYIIHWPEKQ